jgi:hypothetical protein
VPATSYGPPSSVRRNSAGRSGEPETLGIVVLILAIPVVLAGVGFLVAASFAHSEAAAADQACAHANPPCPGPNAPDTSGGLTVGGILLLIIGAVMLAFGANQYHARES